MTYQKKQPVSRRSFLATAGIATAAMALYPKNMLFAKAIEAQPPSDGAITLAGNWRFALDRTDAGVKANWFAKVLNTETNIALPGILQTQGFGDEITADTKFVAALPRDMRWYLLPQYKPYTVPGNVQVPYLSQPVRHYLGVAWYQRDIEIPAGWAGKRVELLLERTRWQTDIYVGDKLIGSNRSLVAPHDFDLGVLKPRKHLLTIRIDNSMLSPTYRPDGHAVSDGEGSTWNGIVGRIELLATSPVWIADAQVFPNLAAKSAQVRVSIGNTTGKAGTGTLSAGGVSVPVKWEEAGGKAVIDVPMPDARAWSEFTPELQHISLKLSGGQADHDKQVTFGMREIKTDGNRILLNGEQLQLRATHDGGGFPLTGYPATDVATWKKIIGICKAWGLNGMRFHSWCPPEAAFTASDELGFYLQPECGMWNAFDADGKMLAVLNDETTRLLKAYGNHPSLLMLGATNEPAGNYAKQLPGWEKAWKEADPRRLYTDGTGRWAPPPAGAGTPFAADFLVTGSPARGPRGWFGSDYEESLNTIRRGANVPCIGHEIGQYCAYPDFGIIEKFAGKGKYAAFPGGIGWGKVPYMQPGNYIIMRDSARTHGILAQNKALAHASGRFQVACYKEEIEALLRTKSYSGYELLDLHDYLGQGGALIGLLDAFWEEKGYVTANEFKRFNNTTVPLIRLKERIFTTDQTLTASAEVAHYGPAPLSSVTPTWRILNSAGKALMNGSLPTSNIARGSGQSLGNISADLSKLPAPASYSLVLDFPGTGFSNQWTFWLYPAGNKSETAPDVLVSSSWDEAKARLAAGGKVLFLSGTPEKPSSDLALTTSPIFWNRLMNPNRTWMLGLLNDFKHGALAGFPTGDNCDFQWVNLLPKTVAMNMEALSPALNFVVQPIDDWNRNLRLSMLFECQVGNGKLMVTSFDLSDNAAGQKPAAAALRKSVVNYMASAKFKPQNKLAMSELEAWMPIRYVAPVILNSPPATSDVADPGQVKQ
ncbi:twin-arginine translocation signal domain-containing protein [Mucilaginibacter mali]|uniref:beta-galactosidase n=1 Tax=Mucilaginibacter mali TaxID=2740462 RepID=A0A7D4UFU5_9SPHI|nr:sugar-binding domain-containing protein [Mucilaginibacter mali]QKJ33159.1 twin-arginine translocation signal domain-containing protein [Mucilaginibacter mali]